MRNSSKELIDTLRSHDLTANNLGKIYTLQEDRLRQLLSKVSSIISSESPSLKSEFSFTANDHLSGAPTPCIGTECRIPPARELARFAALYAEHVAIRNPLERYSSHENITLDSAEDRNGIVADISVLLTFAPLIDAGIVSFSSNKQHLCPVCIYEADRKGLLSEIIGDEATAGWEKRVSAMVSQLRKEFKARTTGQAYIKDGQAEIELTGDADLVPHGTIYHPVDVPRSWMRDIRTGKKKLLTPQQLWNSRVLNGYIRRIIDDITIQNHYANTSQSNYITDRAVDLALVDSVNSPTTRDVNRTALSALTHGLPFLDSISLTDIIKIRKTEGESFHVYRDALTSTLATARTGNEREARQAFSDLVRPELNKIDLIVNNARHTLAKGVATEISLSIAVISVALFGGLLPPEWAQIFAALGGAAGSKGVATKAIEAFRIPKEASENRFFFLWKLKKHSKKARGG